MPRMKDQISALPNEQKVSASRQERGCYTVDDLAQILGVGHKAIYALIHKKAFPAKSFEDWLKTEGLNSETE